ncbi:MAG TPA: HNH endonuclease [Blastocatellia bacterium]|nr:HNH endonuclease [Blastocatellia bacterium]
MIPLIRSFKRHYHRVKGLLPKMYRTGSFQFQVKFDQTSGEAKCETPDPSETVRFVVLMRPFLNPLEPIYYANVWSFLRDKFAAEIAPEIVEGVEKFIAEMNNGYIPINYNDEVLTAEKIYRLVAEGNYFAEEEEFLNRLKEITSVPIMGPLLEHSFYTYNEQAFVLATNLLKVIHQIEQTETYKVLVDVSPKGENRCIFCLTTSGDFSTEEHIFPESLGNDELILPKGMVCKNCNNNVLSPLDQALVEFPPIGMLRVYYLPYTKKGKLPKTEFGDVTIEKTHPRHIKWTAKEGANPFTEETELEDGRFKFSFHLESKKAAEYTALQRALYKISLGMAAFDKGQEYACNSRFDAARAFILGKGDAPNKVLCRKHSQPNPEISIVSYLDWPEGTALAISIFGLVFLLNLEEKPPMEINEILTQAGFIYLPEE